METKIMSFETNNLLDADTLMENGGNERRS